MGGSYPPLLTALPPGPGLSGSLFWGSGFHLQGRACSLRDAGSATGLHKHCITSGAALGPSCSFGGHQLAVTLLSLEPAWSHALRPQSPAQGACYEPRAFPHPLFSSPQLLHFQSLWWIITSIWSLIYLHNRYRVPFMCQALARSWALQIQLWGFLFH